MKLSFECNQDLKLMPNINGKKFCSSCQKHVFDLRRKSDEKIAAFYKSNPTACVIAYQDQLDKLVRNNADAIKTRKLFPYVASIIAASILPNLIIANHYVYSNNITQGVSQTKKDSITTLYNKTDEEKYFVEVRVNLISNKRIRKANREIVICQYKLDSLNESRAEDTLAVGKIDKKGRANLVVSKKAFDLILKNENISVSISGFTRERIESVEIKEKKIELKISASGRGPIRGKF
jgi:hypothetical protein